MPKGIFQRTKEHRQKIAESTHKSWTDERMRKASERGAPWNVGREKSAAERASISARNSGAGNYFHGKKHSEETKKKLSEQRKGKSIFPTRLRKYGVTEEIYWQRKADGMRWCSKCKQFLASQDFVGKITLCGKCNSVDQKARRDAMPEEEKKRRKKLEYQKSKERMRRYSLDKKYGVTPEWYDAKLAEQAGRCAVCNTDQNRGYRLAVDHCHVTNKVRGLLCSNCNLILEAMERDGWHERALAYLAAYKAP